MNWLAIIGAFGTVVGLAGIAGVIWFSVRHSYGKATVDALQQDVNNWKNRVDERDRRIENLEEEAERKDAALRRMGEQLQSQEAQIRDLREMVLQRAEFAQLVEATTLHEHAAQERAEFRKQEHAKMMAMITEVKNDIHTGLDAIRKLQTVVNDLFKLVRDKLR